MEECKCTKVRQEMTLAESQKDRISGPLQSQPCKLGEVVLVSRPSNIRIECSFTSQTVYWHWKLENLQHHKLTWMDLDDMEECRILELSEPPKMCLSTLKHILTNCKTSLSQSCYTRQVFQLLENILEQRITNAIALSLNTAAFTNTTVFALPKLDSFYKERIKPARVEDAGGSRAEAYFSVRDHDNKS